MLPDPWKSPDHYRPSPKPENKVTKVTDSKNKDLINDACRLAGQSWHRLSSKDTALAIQLQHVHKLLLPALRHPGQCLVGGVAVAVDL